MDQDYCASAYLDRGEEPLGISQEHHQGPEHTGVNARVRSVILPGFCSTPVTSYLLHLSLHCPTDHARPCSPALSPYLCSLAVCRPYALLTILTLTLALRIIYRVELGTLAIVSRYNWISNLYALCRLGKYILLAMSHHELGCASESHAYKLAMSCSTPGEYASMSGQPGT